MPTRKKKPNLGLILTPGAGADRNQEALVAIDEALTADGVAVDRVDFPYRQAGRKAPDRPEVLIKAVIEAAGDLAGRTGLSPQQILLGGRSMGGRICSMAVAEGLPAAGLVLISYPLHPPGKPEKPRTAHFPALSVPCLFVSGTKDPFGSPADLEEAIRTIRGQSTLRLIERGDHGLRRATAEVVQMIQGWVEALTTMRPRKGTRGVNR